MKFLNLIIFSFFTCRAATTAFGWGDGGHATIGARADIMTCTAWTNVLGNVSRLGDALTNSFQNSVVRPGENLTMTVSLSDPAGGKVAIAGQGINPSPMGCASWSGIVNSPANGQPATATFYFAPTAGDEGTLYTVTLNQTDSDGPAAENWTVYVPTADEQKVYITEFLANPATNSTAPSFNPLKRRNGDTTQVASWDQYVEIANLSSAPVYFGNWSLYVGSTQAFQDYNFDTLYSSNYFLIYGGGFIGDNSPPSNWAFEAANIGEIGDTGLFLPTTGEGVIGLYNGNNYLVDRVVYSASQLNSNGSLSRFPKLSSGFVPQPWISTNLTTPGFQYDGGSWGLPTTVPKPVAGVAVSAGNPNPVTLSFSAITTNASTLWEGNNVSDTFQVIFGYHPLTTSGSFTITNAPGGHQFYIITTQP